MQLNMGLLRLVLLVVIRNINCDGVYNVSNWKYHFPSGAGMGIYAALALPVADSRDIDLFCAVFFEAYYSLPANQTSFEYPPLVSDPAFGRKRIYDFIEEKISSKGYPGKSCLLRIICEAAMFTTLHANGLIGDLVHLLLTPSSTKEHDPSNLDDYQEAEESGWKSQSCRDYDGCPINLLDSISFIK